MEQTSKHSPRIDDAIAHDTASLLHGAPVESRSQEERLQEDPSVDPGIRHEAREAPGLGISEPDATERAELARHLAGAAFPARQEDLVAAAEADYAPDGVLAALRRLPADEHFVNVQAVWTALGGPTEDAHT